MTMEGKSSEGGKRSEFPLPCFLHQVQPTAFQRRKTKVCFQTTLMNLYVAEIPSAFNSLIMPFVDNADILRALLLAMFEAIFEFDMGRWWLLCFFILFLHSTHMWRITVSSLICYKRTWDLSNSMDIKKYCQILGDGKRWFLLKDYWPQAFCHARKRLMTS